MVSVSIGAAMPGFFINGADSTADDVRKLLFIEAIVVTVPYIFLMVLFRDSPERPPSKAARIIAEQPRESYKKVMKALFTNKDYLMLIVAAAFNSGTFGATVANLDQIINAMGY
jgi:hypothetical protein